MTRPGPSDGELRSALEEALAAVGAPAPASIGRQPSEYRTSFPLERLSVGLDGGGELRLAFKRLDWGALGDDARLAKPRALHDPRREPAVYSSLLGAAPPGAPVYFGSVARDDDARWLFVEWVEGRELYQVGERAAWAAAARWLGGMHAALATGLDRHVREARLLQGDAAAYGRWAQRAREFAPDASRPLLNRLAGRYDAVAEELSALPRTVIHGDFNAANVLIAGSADELRVAPVDWESAATGPGLLDLAALVSGDWSSEDREELVAAYASTPGLPPFSVRELDLARLHLAVQWLGWAPPEWVAPEGQRHDWLADAIALSDRLDI